MSKVNVSLHTFKSPKFVSIVWEALNFMLQTPVHLLPPENSFGGVGVYALYYSGDFPPYRHVGKANKTGCILPIYVGKAVPTG